MYMLDSLPFLSLIKAELSDIKEYPGLHGLDIVHDSIDHPDTQYVRAACA